MARVIIQTDKAPKPIGAFSQGVKAGGFVFVSGQGPFDPATGQVVGDTMQQQTARCFENVKAVLEAAGSSLDKIVSASFLMAEGDDYAGLNEEWAKWFPAGLPARQGGTLPVKGTKVRISISAIAEV